jgi:hypothetical protein
MYLHVASSVTSAGQEAGVMPKARVLVLFVVVEASANCGHIVEFPDVDTATDRHFSPADSQPHRFEKIAKVSVEDPFVVSQKHELTCLIGGNQQREIPLRKYLWKVRSMYTS